MLRRCLASVVSLYCFLAFGSGAGNGCHAWERVRKQEVLRGRFFWNGIICCSATRNGERVSDDERGKEFDDNSYINK